MLVLYGDTPAGRRRHAAGAGRGAPPSRRRRDGADVRAHGDDRRRLRPDRARRRRRRRARSSRCATRRRRSGRSPRSTPASTCSARRCSGRALEELTPDNDQGELYLTDVVGAPGRRRPPRPRPPAPGPVGRPRHQHPRRPGRRGRACCASGSTTRTCWPASRHRRPGDDLHRRRGDASRRTRPSSRSPCCAARRRSPPAPASARTSSPWTPRSARMRTWGRSATCGRGRCWSGAPRPAPSSSSRTRRSASARRCPISRILGMRRSARGATSARASITANYDGFDKHPTVIGENVRTGSHNVFVAPVTIGDGAWTAAGSAITDDVPPDALGVARAKQTNIEGYVQTTPALASRPRSRCSRRSLRPATPVSQPSAPTWVERAPHKRLMLFSRPVEPGPGRADRRAPGRRSWAHTELKTFTNGEVYVRYEESIRGADVFIVQSCSSPTNDSLMELLIMVNAARLASAKRITAVMPWYPYSRPGQEERPARADHRQAGRRHAGGGGRRPGADDGPPRRPAAGLLQGAGRPHDGGADAGRALQAAAGRHPTRWTSWSSRPTPAARSWPRSSRRCWAPSSR